MEILTLGEKIKKRRKELNLTLRELAGSRITPAQLSYVETDKCKPSLDLLIYISDKLKIEIDYLLESEMKQVARICKHRIILSCIDIENGSYDSARERLLSVLEYAENYGLDDYLGEAYKHLGDLYRCSGQYVKAIDNYLLSLGGFLKIDDYPGISETYMGLGLIAFDKGLLDSSECYFKQSEGYAEKTDDTEAFLKCKAYYYLMMVYAKLKEVKNCTVYADKTAFQIEQLMNRRKFSEVLTEKSIKYEQMDRYDMALECVEKAKYMFESIFSPELMAKMETNLGWVYSTNGNIGSSFIHLYRSLQIKRLINDNTLPITMLLIANNYILRNEYDRAFDIINEALDTAIKLKSRKYEAYVYYMLYKAFKHKGDYIKADDYIKRCVDGLKKVNETHRLADCLVEMSKFYTSVNRDSEAFECSLKALDLYESCNE